MLAHLLGAAQARAIWLHGNESTSKTHRRVGCKNWDILKNGSRTRFITRELILLRIRMLCMGILWAAATITRNVAHKAEKLHTLLLRTRLLTLLLRTKKVLTLLLKTKNAHTAGSAAQTAHAPRLHIGPKYTKHVAGTAATRKSGVGGGKTTADRCKVTE